MENSHKNNSNKPNYLILGGCGFIGRNLIHHLVSEDIANKIRVVDKVPPQVAWLNSRHTKTFSNPIVEFKSANLINETSCASAFAPNEDDICWDYVINCAAETKIGQTDPVYQEGILKLSLNCANEAVKRNVKHYVEMSSGNMYSSEKNPHKEDGMLEPWTFIAKWKCQVEKELQNIQNLRYTVLRLPRVYGFGDRSGLTPRLIFGAIYKQLNETMKLLWTANLKLNTVHVTDVCRAALFVCGRNDTVGKVYNVVDTANSTQGTVTEIVADIFGIQYDYLGFIMSTIAKTDLASVMEEINDKHMAPWAEACRQSGIENTPLSPYMGEESLHDKHLHLDGSRLAQLGFSINVPSPTKQLLKEILDDYIEMKIFPKSIH